MNYHTLSNTTLHISKICLGTMTFGEQNTETEAHAQLDFAFANGINFIDSAEMYPIPRNSATQGLTEKYIGTWLVARKNRTNAIIATKASGPGPNLGHISDHLGFSRPRLFEAVDKSLGRLQTDYIDLYQLHWPERDTNNFGKRGYTIHDQQWTDNFEEAIETLHDLVKQGKIRFWGLSNETPWAVMRVKEICDQKGIDRFASIQNPYNLLNRTFEIGLSEMSLRMGFDLLAYSPLAFGLLSGKYNAFKDKPNDRLNKFKSLSRYNGVNSKKATEMYINVAARFGLSPTQFALAFVQGRPWVGATIIGATNLDQLKEDIDSVDIVFTKEMEDAVHEVHLLIPDPAP